MQRLFSFQSLCVLIIACAAGLSAAARGPGADNEPDRVAEMAARLHEQVGHTFSAVESEHFAVIFDADALLARKLASRLEANYADVLRFCQRNELPCAQPDEHLHVLLFDSPQDYHAYADSVGFTSAGTLGFFHADTNRSAFFNAEHDPRLAEVRRQIAEAQSKTRSTEVARLEALLDQYERQINQMVVQHEGAHQVLYNVGLHSPHADNPLWLVEGLAMLFESVPPGRESSFNQVNQFRLFDLREALRAGREVMRLSYDDFQHAVAAERLVDLRALIGRHDLWSVQGPEANNYYAQAWALTHYLHQTRRKEFSAYVQAQANRPAQHAPTDPLADFEAVFGPLDERFQRRWIAYLLRLPPPRIAGKVL